MPKVYERIADGEPFTVCKLNEETEGKVAAWLDRNFVKIDGEPRPPAFWQGHFRDYLIAGYDQAVTIDAQNEYCGISPYSGLNGEFRLVGEYDR